MTEFNDLDTRWPSVRLASLYRTAHLLRRMGAHNVTVHPETRSLEFRDRRVDSFTMLQILPWSEEDTGWYWYARVSLPAWSMTGPVHEGRYILMQPSPRQVVRWHQRCVRLELRTPRIKIRK